MQSDPMLDLLPAGAATMPLLQELGAALIAYTPPTFEEIHCEITEGLEQGQRALFYSISCPQFPDDGTTVVNDRVHKAATLLVRHLAPAPGARCRTRSVAALCTRSFTTVVPSSGNCGQLML